MKNEPVPAKNMTKTIHEDSVGKHIDLNLSCFKAYDIRGHMPDEMNEDVAFRIGRACA